MMMMETCYHYVMNDHVASFITRSSNAFFHYDSSFLSIPRTTILLLLVGVAFWIFRLLLQYYRRSIESIKPFDHLPMPPGNHFLWGHVPAFLNQDFQHGQAIMEQHVNAQGRLGHWAMSKRGMVLTQWSDVKAVLLHTDSRKLSPLIRHHLDHIVGPGNFLVLRGRAWKFHRSAVIKSLTGASSVQTQQRAILQVTQTLIQSLHKKYHAEQQHHDHDTTTTKSFMELDVEPLMKMVTMDVFGQAALSTDFGCCQHLASSPVARAFDFLGHELTRRMYQLSDPSNLYYSIPTRRNLQHAQARRLLQTFMQQLIQERQAEEQQNKATSSATPHHDILSFMLQAHETAKEQDREFVSEESLRTILLSLVFAGYDTTSVCLSYALFLLATHPHEQQVCADEAQRVFHNHNNKKETTTTMGKSETNEMDDDDDHDSHVHVQDLVYCKAVIMEALRLYPPAFTLSRHVDKDLTLHDGFVVPAGTSVLLPFWTIQRLERHFPHANEFRPDRWVQPSNKDSSCSVRTATGDQGGDHGCVVWVDRPEQEEEEEEDGGDDHGKNDATKSHHGKNNSVSHDDSTTTTIPAANRNAFFAFSAGSRSCPGQKFALQEATLVLAALVKEFQFVPVPGYQPYPIRHGIVQCPKDGMPVRLQPRRRRGQCQTTTKEVDA
jgi:cytochrome P450